MARRIDTQTTNQATATPWHCLGRRKLFSRILLLAVLTAVCISLSSTSAHAENTDPRIAKIRAAFAYTLAKFVEWPDAAFKNTTSPFVICIDEDDVYAAAHRSLQGKAVKNRATAIRLLASSTYLKDCHVALLSAGSDHAEIQRSAAEHHALTIGSGRSFAQTGGMVASYFVNNKLRFSINLISAREAGLTISSHALGLAEEVIQ